MFSGKGNNFNLLSLYLKFMCHSLVPGIQMMWWFPEAFKSYTYVCGLSVRLSVGLVPFGGRKFFILLIKVINMSHTHRVRLYHNRSCSSLGLFRTIFFLPRKIMFYFVASSEATNIILSNIKWNVYERNSYLVIFYVCCDMMWREKCVLYFPRKHAGRSKWPAVIFFVGLGCPRRLMLGVFKNSMIYEGKFIRGNEIASEINNQRGVLSGLVNALYVLN